MPGGYGYGGYRPPRYTPRLPTGNVEDYGAAAAGGYDFSQDIPHQPDTLDLLDHIAIFAGTVAGNPAAAEASRYNLLSRRADRAEQRQRDFLAQVGQQKMEQEAQERAETNAREDLKILDQLAGLDFLEETDLASVLDAQRRYRTTGDLSGFQGLPKIFKPGVEGKVAEAKQRGEETALEATAPARSARDAAAEVAKLRATGPIKTQQELDEKRRELAMLSEPENLKRQQAITQAKTTQAQRATSSEAVKQLRKEQARFGATESREVFDEASGEYVRVSQQVTPNETNQAQLAEAGVRAKRRYMATIATQPGALTRPGAVEDAIEIMDSLPEDERDEMLGQLSAAATQAGAGQVLQVLQEYSQGF